MANCYVFTDPTFQPAFRIIDNITNDNPAVITTSTDHNFITGEIVRLSLPNRYGMHEIDKIQGEITVTSDTSFEIDIDTTHITPFSEPAESYQCAVVVPIGEIASQITGATKNVLRNRSR